MIFAFFQKRGAPIVVPYQRSLATCSLTAENLNAWMVQQGWALAYVRYSSTYRQAEDDARTNRRGLWQGAFIAPWDWRHKNNKTVILGAFSVPLNAQAILLGPSAIEGAPSADCTIKGNVKRRTRCHPSAGRWRLAR